VRSASGLGVDHPLLLRPAQRFALMLEFIRGSQLSIHGDEDNDVPRVRQSSVSRERDSVECATLSRTMASSCT
jgi:hypothetical protein